MNPNFSILKALAAEEIYGRITGRRPELLRAHPMTMALLEMDVWTFQEVSGVYGMPGKLIRFWGMDVLEDPALPEGEFRVGTREEFEHEVLLRLDVWRVKNLPARGGD